MRLRRLIGVTVIAAIALAACADDSNDNGADPGTDDTDTEVAIVLADDIPKQFTPEGGYGTEMPPPILEGCTEELVDGAPDLRGVWRVVDVTLTDGSPAPDDHVARKHFERIEQCGDRLVVTGGGVVHDMRVDGTAENGVNDVAARDYTTPITVVATFEDGALVLRPVDIPGVEVRRSLDGAEMVWEYVGFTARLERD